MSKKVGVLLAGCGAKDGSEIREATLTLLALDKYNADISIFAPNREQTEVCDHLFGQPLDHKRNILMESARIARGQIDALDQIDVSDLDALIMPGGFGAAKNFSNFPEKGADGELSEDIKELIMHFYDNKKPIGAICIFPVLLSLLLGKEGIEITAGADEATALLVEGKGAKHVVKPVNECHVDKKHKIVTTPAYMYGEARLYELSQGIEALVKNVLDLC